MLIQHSNYLYFYAQIIYYYSAGLFCASSAPTFHIAETPFKHENVQLDRESMAITFLIHTFHISRDISHNSSHFLHGSQWRYSSDLKNLHAT